MHTAKTKKVPRIGIYAGSFNPVHAGHISFALQALATANLDTVYFLPERQPRHKPQVEHFGHRVAMLKRAARPHKHLRVLELEDTQFTVAHSLPRLRRRFPDAQLVFLVGSDVVRHMPQWANVAHLCETSELLVGMRQGAEQAAIECSVGELPLAPRAVIVFESYASEVSSRAVRQALQQQYSIPGMLQSVQRYANRHWLYVSLA